MINASSHPNSLTGVARYLYRDGVLPLETAQAAQIAAFQQKMSLITYLVKFKIISGTEILICCEKHFNFPIFDLNKYNHDWLRAADIPIELIHRYRILPLNRDDHTLYLALADPTDSSGISAISFHTGLRIHPMLVAEDELDKILTRLRRNYVNFELESTLAKIATSEEKSSHHQITDQDNDDGPVSEFIERLIHDAIQKSVSDIHIEPFSHLCRIRFRRDGLLYEATSTPPQLAARIITRLKIMSNLNIAERRLPQDGRLYLSKQAMIDIRINTCPTLFGEKIVLRILDVKRIKLDINSLGLNDEQKQLFLSCLSQPQGLILVTGPTGSGKTVTLYSALHYLNQIEKNLLSVEDPVEIEFFGINQVNIHTRIGLDFANVLRTFLRQDPDVIMVGEIRDAETASIATQAAQTGHLVLSTLHTNSAVETIVRLQSISSSAIPWIHSVFLIIAQRLVRKLCEHCKQLETSDIANLNTTIYQAGSCEYCCKGYQGRTGIYELVLVKEEISKLMLTNANIGQITEAMQNEKRMRLWEAGMQKVREGITTYNEIVRVVGDQYEKN